jgi:hypothetical protein
VRRSTLSLTLVVAALCTLAGGPPRASAGLALVQRTGQHFRVWCHFDDEKTADAALETVEAVWPSSSSLFGLPDRPLEPPLDVHLYRRAADYLAVERQITGGRWAENLGFSDVGTRASHVPVQPDISDETLAAVGLTAQTRHTLAHEAVHLVSYRATAGSRTPPEWVSEGAAIWIERQTLVARGWSAGDEEDPFAATDMVAARELLAGGALPTATQILRGEAQRFGFRQRYAMQWLLFRRLITRNDGAKFRSALLEAMRTPPGADHTKRFNAVVTTPYGTEGGDGLDLDFEQYVRSQRPAWVEPHRALSTAGGAWVQAAFADTKAIAWRTAPVGASRYEIRGEVEILPGLGERDQANVLFGRDDDDGYVSVAFAARDAVGIWRYLKREDRWERLGAGATNALQLRRRVPFRIMVDRGRITVRVDGAEVVSADVKDRPLSGAWGLGVHQGAAAVWRRVRVEKPSPRDE